MLMETAIVTVPQLWYSSNFCNKKYDYFSTCFIKLSPFFFLHSANSHWTPYGAAALPPLHTPRRPQRIFPSFAGFIEIFQARAFISRRLCLSAEISMSVSRAERRRGAISSRRLPTLLLLAEAQWYEGNVSRLQRPYLWEYVNLKCIVSAAREIQCSAEQWWKRNEYWPAASLLFVLEYFMSICKKEPGQCFVQRRRSNISCTQSLWQWIHAAFYFNFTHDATKH